MTAACTVCGAQLSTGDPGSGQLAALQPGALFDSECQTLPAQIGRYRIEREIGRGLTEVVYEAHAQDGQRYALKRLHANWKRSRRFVASFRTEADMLARLRHPNVISIADGEGLEADLPYFTMELAEGSLCSEPQELAPDEAARLVTLIARAVDFVYRRGVLHRDLKPGNVLRVPGRELVVADFGLALDLDEPPSLGASEHGCGTPGYFAPEVARGEPATCTSDVYSIGVILYELMTHRLPVPVSFEARYYAERVQTWEVVPPRKPLKGVSRGLDAVCMKALARQPEHRYQTADLLAEDLDRVRAGHRPRYASVPTVLQGTTRFARRYPVLAAVLASLLLLVCSAGSLAFALYRFDIDVERYALGQLRGQATQYAAAVVTQLEIYGGWARAAAADAQTLAILENGTTDPGGNLYLKPYWLSGHFSTITVLTPDGRPLTQYPEPSRRGYYEQSYGWRDYVTRARRLATYEAPGASLVAAFRSRADGKFKSAFVVAVFDAAHVYRGFLLATRAASGSFGNVIARNHAEGRIVTLLAPTESGASSVPERSLSIVVHPGIRTDLDEYRPSKHEQARLLSVASCRKERQEEQLVIGSTGRVLAVADYVDAVPGYLGFRLAAAAAVGCTGYVLMIQERSESLPFWRALDRSGAGRAGLVHALALILMLGVMILTVRFYLRR